MYKFFFSARNFSKIFISIKGVEMKFSIMKKQNCCHKRPPASVGLMFVSIVQFLVKMKFSCLLYLSFDPKFVAPILELYFYLFEKFCHWKKNFNFALILDYEKYFQSKCIFCRSIFVSRQKSQFEPKFLFLFQFFFDIEIAFIIL